MTPNRFFSLDSGDPLERWARMRRYFAHWYDAPLEDRGGEASDLANLKAETGCSISVAVREWLAFTEQVTTNPALASMRELLRDDRYVSCLPEHEALSLQLQAEGDVHWVVPYSRLEEPDPSVQIYLLDHEAVEDGRFMRWERADIPSVTDFAASYLFSYHNIDHGFQTIIEKPSALRDAMTAKGQKAGALGQLTIYEGAGWTATLDRLGAFSIDDGESTLRVVMGQKTKVADLPEPLQHIEKTATCHWKPHRTVS
jgi:hypothetical protein